MRENERACERACARIEASLFGTYLSDSHTRTLDEGPRNFQHVQGSHCPFAAMLDPESPTADHSNKPMRNTSHCTKSPKTI